MEPVEEEVVPIWTLFADKLRKRAETKNKISEKVKKYKKKSENPLRAQLFMVMKQYIQMDVRQICRFLTDLTPEYFDDLLRPNKRVTKTENRDAQLIKLVKYVVENKEKEFIVGLISALQLRLVCRNKEKVTWRAMEIGREPSEEDDEQDTTNEEQTNLSKFGRNWRKNLDELYQNDDEDDAELTAVQSRQEPPYVFLALTSLNVTRRKRKKSTVSEASTVVAAFNPKYRFLLIHPLNNNSVLQSTILNFITTMGRGFTGFRALNLQDVGLSRVVSCCTRSITEVNEASIQQSSPSNDVDDALDNDMVRLASAEDSAAKRRKLMAELIDDQTESGFKTLTFQFSAPKYNDVEEVGLPSADGGENTKKYPITFKFTSKVNKMDSMFAEMVKEGYLEDVDMYLKARNSKTNTVTKAFNEMV